MSAISTDISDPQRNPLVVHPEYRNLLLNRFAEIEERSHSASAPCNWVHYPDFWFWDGDYRVVRVYNMPHVFNIGQMDNFFKASLILFQEARAVADYDEGIARAAGRAIASLFYDDLRTRLQGSNELRTLAQFLGTDEETAYDSFFMGMGMMTFSRIAHGVSVAAALLEIFEVISLSTPLAALLDAACFFSTRSALSKQRCLNYAMLMSCAYDMLMTNPDHILDSNAFVTAVDERNFYAIFRSSAFRRNDGVWCDFVYIPDLRRAPKARDCYSEDDIRDLSRRFNELMRNSQQ